MRKEIKNFYIIPNDNKINEYNSDSFIFPLENFSVGFDKYFSIEEINKYALVYNVSVIINKFLHKEDLIEIKNHIKKLHNIKYFFVEDFALTSIISKNKLVLFPNHIISNFYSINYLNTLGYKNVVVSNELTVNELINIQKKVKCNLFYVYLGKNPIMYSKRELLNNYYNFFDIVKTNKKLQMQEVATKKELLFYEENKSTIVFDNKIFCASKYKKTLKNYNFIVNFSNINIEEKKLILNNINSDDLCDLIDSDYDFLEEKIMYKVGDLK